LYKYVLEDLNKTPQEAVDYANISPRSISAFELDLNDYGTNEIIGLVWATYYWGTAGYSLFVLEKKGDSYYNLADLINFEPLKKIYILPEKTNGYRDIKFYGSSAYKFKPMVVKFNNQKYYNLEQINLLEEYLKDFSGYDVSEITGTEE